MTAAKRPPQENKPCYLINKDENDQLFKLIGPRCKSIASAVVQVCFADPPSRAQWNKRHCGVLCFIKDNYKRSYFLRVYCLDLQTTVWEQELYSNFEYRAPRPYFHTFEGDTCRVGLNFADENEAEFFLAAVKENLRHKAERRERRRLSQQPVPSNKPALQASNGSPSTTNIRPPVAIFDTKKKSKKDKNRKLTKADIGLPSDFKHVSHVGWDPNQGFAIENVDPQLLQFLAKAGVSENHLKDKATRDFIYDFIDKHGGTEAAIREVSNQQSANAGLFAAPPVPTRNVPSTPQFSARMAPPAPPASAPPPPPPPPSRVVASPGPAPVPPAPPQRGPPKTMAPAAPSSVPPPPPMNSCPPPPPPPPMTGAPEPPPPPMPPSLPPQPDTRGALMNAIREGAKLKHVAPTEVEKPRTSSVNDPRHDLLDQIRAGKDLKPVEKAASAAPAKQDGLDGIAGALARALQERSRVIHSDSEESGQDEDEDDDWDD